MLDPIIREHIKEQDKLEEGLRADIDELMKQIDIDQAMDDPKEMFFSIAEAVEELIAEKYSLDAVKNGIKVARKIEDMRRKVVIQDTDDSDINKESEAKLLESRTNG